MNKFFDTAFGKTVKTFFWVVLAYALTLGTAAIAGYHWSTSLIALGIPGLVNILLYMAKVFVDKAVPNFPGSTPVTVIPTATLAGPLLAALQANPANIPSATPAAESTPPADVPTASTPVAGS